MSWIYSILRQDTRTESPTGAEVHPQSLHVINSSNLYMAIGGIQDTCLFHKDQDKQSGWAVVGLGIMVADTGSSLLNKADWHRFLAGDLSVATSLDGHFVAVRWDRNGVEFFTDQLGLRTVYYGKSNDGICVSTRLDWVARTTGLNEIDFASLGSRWLMFNQIECQSCLKGVERLGPGGYVHFRGNSILRSESKPWLPEFGKSDLSRATAILPSLLRAAFDYRPAVSLGLSGGIDSRLLLSMLMQFEGHQPRTYTFGSEADPDVRTASSIAEILNIGWDHFDDPIPPADKMISEAKSFVAQTCLVEPVSSAFRLRYYPRLQENGRLMIDGGFGEIARRQYLNRVALLGVSAVKKRDTDRLFSLMKVQRGECFGRDVDELMKAAACDSLKRTIDAMPSVDQIGIGNFVDLLALRTRVPNNGSPEQARIDSMVANFMPLVQPSFLQAVFEAGTDLRSDGQFYRQLIRKNCPHLAKVPLVKSGTTYGFNLSTRASWLATKVKKLMLAKPYVDPAPDRFLFRSKEYILDTASSAEVSTWGPYDTRKLHHIVDGYFSGKGGVYRQSLDWWLTLELWRRSLK